MNFSYQRTALQAVGWYLTFLLIGVFIAAIAIGAVLAMIGGAALPAQFVAIPYDIVLAVALLWRPVEGHAEHLLGALGRPAVAVFRATRRPNPIGRIDHTPNTEVARGDR
jgi:hypothetical protein